MSYQWLLFDADGTLFDFEKTAEEALHRTFQDFGEDYDPAFFKLYRSIDKRLWEALEQGTLTRDRLHAQRFEELLARLGVERDAKTIADQYLGHVGEGTHLIEGAADVVAFLAERARLALITNGFAHVQRPRFARAPIARHFEWIVISDEVGVAKPNPGIFDEALRKMGSPDREDVLLIGDSLSADIRGGLDYGIDVCWFNPFACDAPANMKITYVIRELAELCDMI